MRQFKKIIHMGNGNDSLAECYKLHQRLEEGIITLCGIQQAPVTSLVKNRDQDLNHIIEDIVVALGGNIGPELCEYCHREKNCVCPICDDDS